MAFRDKAGQPNVRPPLIDQYPEHLLDRRAGCASDHGNHLYRVVHISSDSDRPTAVDEMRLAGASPQ
jgi:hypothetical protein